MNTSDHLLSIFVDVKLFSVFSQTKKSFLEKTLSLVNKKLKHIKHIIQTNVYGNKSFILVYVVLLTFFSMAVSYSIVSE